LHHSIPPGSEKEELQALWSHWLSLPSAPTAVHVEKRVLLLNPDHCAAGNAGDCC